VPGHADQSTNTAREWSLSGYGAIGGSNLTSMRAATKACSAACAHRRGTYTLTADAGDSADPQNTGTRTIKVKVGLGLLPATLAEGRPQGRPRRRGD